ncbi:MAG: hypothetical protein ACP5JG_14905, partial [Anaerolineae bacterium]
LSTQAFNALLKTLEEPPEHVIFVLATTEVHKIPETILSRCQRFEFRRIPVDAIVERLEMIAEAEGIETEPEALELIARSATGAMRDAISLFDQMSAGGNVTADYVRLMLGAERREVVRSLLEAWVEEDVTEGLRLINHAVDSGADPRQLARQTADFLRGLLLMRLGAGQMWADPTAEERPALEALARKADPDRLVEAVRRFSEVASKQRTGWQPQLPLELAFVEATVQAPSVDDLASELSTIAKTAPASADRARETKRTSVSGQTASVSVERARERRSTAQSPSVARETARASSERPQAASSRSAGTKSSAVGESSESPASARSEESSEGAPEAQPSGEAAESATETPALDSELVSKIRTYWRDIISRVKPVTLGALLRDAEVGGVDSEGRLVLTFQHTFHRERVSEASNLSKLEDSFAELIKRRLTLRCLLKDEWVPETSHASTSDGISTASDEEEEDELIRRAQEELGAVARVND